MAKDAIDKLLERDDLVERLGEELSAKMSLSETISRLNNPVKESCLIEYLKLESKLREFFDAVSFCKDNCSIGPVGCCHGTHYLDSLIKERIKRYGLPRKGIPLGYRNVCGYHNKKGCLLKTHRPVVCNSLICEEFSDYLKKEYDITYDDSYVRAMLNLALGGEFGESPDSKKFVNIETFKKILDGWVKKVIDHRGLV